jgi:cytochrome oxidase Cu insertion factor (SCO1/SenC/PrrC family)
MRHLAFIPVAALALVALLSAAADAPDPRTLGPKVGQAVPDFVLPDQHGTPRTLKSTFGPKGAVLVFFRSADW